MSGHVEYICYNSSGSFIINHNPEQTGAIELPNQEYNNQNISYQNPIYTRKNT